MGYYEDRLTGSIYSAREVSGMVRRRELSLLETTRRFKAVPLGTSALLREAEEVVGQADREGPSSQMRSGGALR